MRVKTYQEADKIEREAHTSTAVAEDKLTNFNDTFSTILNRIVEELEKKFEESGKKKYELFDEGIAAGIPISKDTWHKYKQGKVMNITLNTFYNICQYTDVSADYLLCFNSAKTKKASAAQIQKDYGLTEEALNGLDLLHKRTNSYINFFYDNKSDFVNFFLCYLAQGLFDSIMHYIDTANEFEEFQATYCKNGKIRKKYLSSDEQEIIDNYHKLENNVDTEKYKLMQKIDRMVESFRKDLKSHN